MGGQFQFDEAESEKASLEGVFIVLKDNAKNIRLMLEDMEYAVRSKNSKVYISLHDEIATAEDLVRMLGNIDIHILTEEELADRG